jgi:hypothetical protein
MIIMHATLAQRLAPGKRRFLSLDDLDVVTRSSGGGSRAASRTPRR